MAIHVLPTLSHYATPPNSYIGATIFLSYIVSALYATLTITYSLHRQYTAMFSPPQPSTLTLANDAKLNHSRAVRARHIKIYAFLASISFATLSYHMLMFLVTHYLSWSGDGSRSLNNVRIGLLKRWMLGSTLFQDFATELVRDAQNVLWTQGAILVTWFWNVWMAEKAQKRGIEPSTMRTYILLSQILPITFTVALFIIQLHLLAPDIQPPTQSTSPTPPPPPKPRASLQFPNILLNVALLAQPVLQGHTLFSTLVLFERYVLLLPHSGLINLSNSEVVKSLTISGGFLVTNAAMVRKGLKLGGVLGALSDGGYAVKALAWDAVLGVMVFGVLEWDRV